MTGRIAHAVVLFSGGLDSTLAVELMRRQDIRVTAITFATCSGCGARKPEFFDSRVGSGPVGFIREDLGQTFVDMIASPRFGRGKNMNPCLDCKILMLREAKKHLDEIGADFLATGEVVGQRPMTQMRHSLNRINSETGLGDIIVRPLSAKLLPPTKPERDGLLDRERLQDISGRSRKRQIALAAEFGIMEYPQSAGGCLLTDPGFSRRLAELLRHQPHPSVADVELLRAGRHFRLPDGAKVIVGRDDQDNALIEHLAPHDCTSLQAVEVGSPISLVLDGAENAVDVAAKLTARYSAARDREVVAVEIKGPQGKCIVEVSPVPPEGWRDWMI